jgi:hypothetical protein
MTSVENSASLTKRGRKRKNIATVDQGDILSQSVLPISMPVNTPIMVSNNIQIVIEDHEPTTTLPIENKTAPLAQRKLKKSISTNDVEQHGGVVSKSDSQIANEPVPVSDLKKRGRKPRGGKLIVKNSDQTVKPPPVANVILHLKCTLKDVEEYTNSRNKLVTNILNYNPEVPPEIMTYNMNDKSAFSVYNDTPLSHTGNSKTEGVEFAYMETIHSKGKVGNGLGTGLGPVLGTTSTLCSECSGKLNETDETTNNYDPEVNVKELNQKLKKLKVSLYKNSIPEKKSACFWCTYEFDNPACHVPKYEMDGSIHGYGSFCRPECAVGYLMKENIDDSSKFERYHLLNQIYGKVYNFKNNIKPAPNPYFILDKFYGNLTIQEYRKLLNTEHMLLVIDKPLTRILPELHEDTDDFIMGIYGGNKGSATQAGGVYKVKRQSEKQTVTSKSSIIRDKFGLTQ